jgi:hypothetical protein
MWHAWGDEKDMTKFWSETLNGKYHAEDLGENWRIILE